VHLKEDLAQTRKRGYSFDDEEHALACAAWRRAFMMNIVSRSPPSLFPGPFPHYR
jgi:hypothetical protein